jgi:hypothetical protein
VREGAEHDDAVKAVAGALCIAEEAVRGVVEEEQEQTA